MCYIDILFNLKLKLKSPFEAVRKILGILGYSKESLNLFNKMPRTPLESTQSIDQSRILENDQTLLSVPFEYGYPGINDKTEGKKVKKILSSDPMQKLILEFIFSNTKLN